MRTSGGLSSFPAASTSIGAAFARSVAIASTHFVNLVTQLLDLFTQFLDRPVHVRFVAFGPAFSIAMRTFVVSSPFGTTPFTSRVFFFTLLLPSTTPVTFLESEGPLLHHFGQVGLACLGQQASGHEDQFDLGAKLVSFVPFSRVTLLFAFPLFPFSPSLFPLSRIVVLVAFHLSPSLFPFSRVIVLFAVPLSPSFVSFSGVIVLVAFLLLTFPRGISVSCRSVPGTIRVVFLGSRFRAVIFLA